MPKRLDDPKEFERVRNDYFEPDLITDETNAELMEKQGKKRRLNKNQAR